MERDLFKLWGSLSPSFQNPPGVSAKDLIRQTRFLGAASGMTSQHASFLEESANSQEPFICASKSPTWIKLPETDTRSPSTQQSVKLLGQRVQTHLPVCAIWWWPVSQRWWQVAELHLPICKEQPLLNFSHLSPRGTVLLDCLQSVKNLPAMQKALIRSLGQEDPLEKEMATHSIILAWRIPWTEETGGLRSMGSQESDTT